MIFRGLYRSVTSRTGQPAVQVPQEKHFLICSPPGSRAIRSLKSGSRSFERIILSPYFLCTFSIFTEPIPLSSTREEGQGTVITPGKTFDEYFTFIFKERPPGAEA